MLKVKDEERYTLLTLILKKTAVVAMLISEKTNHIIRKIIRKKKEALHNDKEVNYSRRHNNIKCAYT